MRMFYYCLALLMLAFSLSASANLGGLHLQIGDATLDINKSDVEELQIFQSGQGLAAAMVKLTPQTATRLYKLTEKNIGQQILWIWNGRVLCTQKLQAPLSGDLTVHNFTSFEAEDFSKSVGFLVN